MSLAFWIYHIVSLCVVGDLVVTLHPLETLDSAFLSFDGGYS